MILQKDGMETKVWILPYEKSSIDETMLVQATDETMLVQATNKTVIIQSVEKYEDSLIEIVLPNGNTVVVNAEQIITAIRKCVL